MSIIQNEWVPWIIESLQTVWYVIRGLPWKYPESNPDQQTCHKDFPNQKTLITLTTNPRRIQNLPGRLRPFLRQADIVVHLPERYQNRERQYQDTIDDLENMGVRVEWHPLDSGPSMKLVPTLQAMVTDKSHDIVVCIDDDLLLGPDMILQYKAFFAKNGPCVASQKVTKFPENNTIDYILGVNTIAIHTSLITQALVDDLVRFNQENSCRMHDDVALIMALHKHKLPIRKGPSFYRENTPDSFSADALWHRDPHSVKDARCQKSLVTLI